LQEIFQMHIFSLGYGVSGDMVEVIFNQFCNKVDYTLNFLTSSQFMVLTQPKKVDDRFRKNDLTNLEIDLLIF